ncbi:methylmalonyl-CoA mutase family protein [Oryzobacter telluris]|uniref:methylmalonyl-CoA mutase family protein n=1 Tax=Oryzobacter telluris TaxID=3149179 RepID=UPI00370DDCFD
MTDGSVATGPEALAAGFAPRDRAAWQELAAAVLNKTRSDADHLDGPSAEQALHRTLEGGLDVAPLYLREDRPLGHPGAMPFTRGLGLRDGTLPWDVRQLHDDPDPARSRAAVLDDLEHGVTSVWLHVGDDGIAPADLPEVLADVRFDLAPVVVSSLDDQAGAALALLEAVGDSTSVGGNLGLDPVGAALRLGTTPDLSSLAAVVRLADSREGWRAITLDARVLHDAGATEIDALAVAVASGVAYLRHLEDDGVDAATAFAHTEFRLNATADQFLTAASLRALRRVWARIGEVSGVAEERRGARTHAVTALRMFSREDPWVNVLRSTLATFGASVGGADAVTVLPYDTVHGLPERFSRRLARNTQILLADESNVGRVTDPGGGSWYLESLTDQVASALWARVQEIEAAGGVVAALDDGLLHAWVSAAASARAPELATRRTPLTGVSMFPLAGEKPLERRQRRQPGAAGQALAPRRDAAVFEALRDRATALGDRASVVVRPLGTQRDSGARQTFVGNLLAVGGLDAVEAGSPLAVIASSRTGYAEHAAQAVADLRAGGAEVVLVAGRRRELGDDADLVDGELYDGMDVVAALDALLTRLETEHAR